MAIPGQGRIKRRLAAILAADVAGYSRPIIRLRIAPVDRRRQRVGAWPRAIPFLSPLAACASPGMNPFGKIGQRQESPAATQRSP